MHVAAILGACTTAPNFESERPVRLLFPQTGQMTVMCERMSRVHQATLHNVVLETQEYATQV